MSRSNLMILRFLILSTQSFSFGIEKEFCFVLPDLLFFYSVQIRQLLLDLDMSTHDGRRLLFLDSSKYLHSGHLVSK